MQNTDEHAYAQGIVARRWQLLVDAACSDSQVATARIVRTEGMLQIALELGVIDMALLLQWGEQAAQRLSAAISNPSWPDSVIRIEDEGEVRIVILHKRAPVYLSTKD